MHVTFFNAEDIKNQETPKKIIKRLTQRGILHSEDAVQAILGRTVLWGIEDCIVATDKDIIYFQNIGTMPKAVRYSYSSVVSVAKATGLLSIIVLTIDSVGNIPLSITAAPKETDQMYSFLQDKVENNKKQRYSPVQTNAVSSSDEIKKLYDLMKAGIITEEEFEMKKKQLLGLE